MTNAELKALCERFISSTKELSSIDTINKTFYGHISGSETMSMATECLRLISQCEAMQKVVEAAKHINRYWDQSILCHIICDPKVNFHEPECCMNRDLSAALSHLGEGV